MVDKSSFIMVDKSSFSMVDTDTYRHRSPQTARPGEGGCVLEFTAGVQLPFGVQREREIGLGPSLRVELLALGLGLDTVPGRNARKCHRERCAMQVGDYERFGIDAEEISFPGPVPRCSFNALETYPLYKS